MERVERQRLFFKADRVKLDFLDSYDYAREESGDDEELDANAEDTQRNMDINTSRSSEDGDPLDPNEDKPPNPLLRYLDIRAVQANGTVL
jgi:hypothetical protein